MGVFRTFLALAVASAHTQMHIFWAIPFKGYGGGAVTSFFMMSGFYMYLIIDTKYGKTRNGTLLFYTNRIYRIFPAYACILLLSFLAMLLTGTTSIRAWSMPAGEFWTTLANFRPTALGLVLFSNVFILFANFVEFSGYLPDGTWTPSDHSAGAKPGWTLLLFPPVWTLAVEAAFYALAPFLVRIGMRLLLAGFLLLYFVPLYRWSNTVLWHDTLCWLQLIVPNDIFYFVAGMFAYRIYKTIDKRSFTRPVGLALAALLVLCCCLYNRVPSVIDYEAMLIFWFVVWLTLPFLFALTRDSKVDHWIGEFSYPIYLSHFLVYKMLDWMLAGPLKSRFYYPVLIVAAGLLILCVDRPLEHLRRRRLMRARQGSREPPPTEPSATTPRVSEDAAPSPHSLAT